MPTLNSVLQNIENFVSTKLESAVTNTFAAELKATVDELLRSPQLPIKPSLKSLFIRYGLDEEVADSLIKSLQTVIKKNQEQTFEPKEISVQRIEFPQIIDNQEYLISKLQGENEHYADFPEQSVISFIEQAALSWAKIVGSNVAEALALADPNALVETKTFAEAILQGRIIDPVILANKFNSLSDEQRTKLINILGNSVTIAKQNNEARNRQMLIENRAEQWLYEKLRANYFPHDIALGLIPTLLREYSIDTLHELNDRQFRERVVRIIKSTSFN